MNILIVDDEAIIREGIKRTLQRAHPQHSIFLAANPEEAVQLLRSRRIDFILTDILMPGMTGLELMQLSRSSYPHVKWVIISAYSEFSYAQEAVRLGARDYLLKPIGKDMLLRMITEVSNEINREAEMLSEASLLKSNLKYVREAVFQRWATGLDTGGINIAPFMERHPTFQLIMINMETDRMVHLEHFIIENVLTELIERHGHGFVVSFDMKSLLGLISINGDISMKVLLDELRIHLKKYLKVPFQMMHSDPIADFNLVSYNVQRMRQESVTQEFEYYATGSSRAIEIALQYINMHYIEDLTLEKVASIVFLNPVYFSQVFKQKTGFGFKEYVTNLRIEQAKQLLLNPQLKLADISERVGYQDVKHFTQVFRKKLDVTPTEYRQERTLELQ
ncbi:response regulator [Paenibacillus pini]|uniref:Two-component response regulator n=1 Tax=Paenibacillus pini JCM 16418 TaxID=1236976 RepID=W7YS98_9BACL|nr:response regulator [Paenibacillus pini]GAF07556.1 two-component response regulator [Paenibacillus pini JCM 16418]